MSQPPFSELPDRFFRRSIPLQLGVFLAFALSILWGWTIFDLRQLHERKTSEASRDSEILARAFAEQVQSSVNAIDITLVDLREEWQGENAKFAEAVRRRQSYLEKEVAFQVAILDANGMLVFSSVDPAARAIDLSDRPHFRIHRERAGDRLFISEPVLGRVSKRWSIQFTRPLEGSGGTFAGVIVLSVAPEYFSRFYQTIDLGAGSAVTLLRSSGEILARGPEPDNALGKPIGAVPFMQAGAPVAGVFQGISPIDGIERIYGWHTLDKGGLVVTVGKSVDEVLERYRQQRRTYLIGGSAMSLLLALIGYFLVLAIRQRAIAAASLAESEARWKFALEGAGDGVWDWDVSKGEVKFSRRWKEMLGYSDDEITGHLDEWSKRVHPDDMPNVMADLQAHLTGKTPSYVNEHRVLCKDGSWKWILDRGMVVSRSADGEPLRAVGTHSDISERKATEDLILHMALHDPLTDLPNRSLFNKHLERAIFAARRLGTSVAVMFIDLDKFKPVNDAYGHEVGDFLLKEVAKRLRACLRESDTVARVGGDEFVVILEPIASEDDAMLVGEKIRQALNLPFSLLGKTMHISSSIGIALYPQHGTNAETLLKNADSMMYRVKNSGRDSAMLYRPVREEDTAAED